MADKRLRIAVVGAGVAGIASAWLLQRRHDVVLLEKNKYVGGHTNTVEIPDGPDAGTPVDTGFIVLNDRTYPLLHRFLKQLDVRVRSADMSFGFCCHRTGLQYAGTSLNGLFAQRANIVSPAFHRGIWDCIRFNRTAIRDLDRGGLDDLTLRDYVGKLGLSRRFLDLYLVPMGGAIWSTSAREMMDFPAKTLVRFFKNHGLLTPFDMPQWQTVVGGSQTYVRAFLERFEGEVRRDVSLDHVRRTNHGVVLRQDNGREEEFDRVVIATHADEALKLLADPSELENRLLGAWSYSRNRTVLHTDTRFLPPNKRAWASWNYTREKSRRDEVAVSLTYHMNRLQGLETRKQYCVTLNTSREIRPKSIIAEFNYTHPLYNKSAVESQSRLPELNGERHTWFAGSYFGFGFHEDAVRSGVAVGRGFGIEL